MQAVKITLGKYRIYAFSMVKIWNEAFWKTAPVETGDNLPDEKKIPVAMIIPVVILGLITLLLGFAVKPVLEFAMNASAQLLDPTAYINAVLNERLP